MKAFDTISPSYYEKQKSLQQISKRSYFVVDKKESIEIPFKGKVQVEAISHEVRKPKVHIIKTKQPHVHILESKGKSMLGFDTGSQEWGHVSMNVQQNSNEGGFFNAFRNANVFHRHSNQLQQESAQNQQIMNQSRNPFELLKQHLWKQSSPQPVHQQPLPINTLGFGLESHMAAMQQQQQQINPPGFKSTYSHEISRQEQQSNQILIQNDYLKMENLQQSHVQPVELQNIRASFPQSQSQQGFGNRLLNFFKSLRPSSEQHQHQHQPHQQHIMPQNIGFKQNQPNQQFDLMIEKSQVQQYQQPEESNKMSQRKVRFEESIVEQYHA